MKSSSAPEPRPGAPRPHPRPETCARRGRPRVRWALGRWAFGRWALGALRAAFAIGALGIGAPGPAQAQDSPAPDPAPDSPAPASPGPAADDQARLDAAVSQYQRGQRAEAQAGLVALVLAEGATRSAVRTEALVYLAEVLYVSGEKERAQVFFEQVLDEQPDYRIDPYVHPPDVCAYFDYVRALKGAAQPPPPPPPLAPPRRPLSVFSPVATYHIREGDRAKGFAYQAGILSTATASLLMGGVLLSDRRYLGGTEEQTQLEALKRAQIGVSVACWGLYTLSAADANRHWRSTQVGLGPRGLSLRGRF